MELYVGINKLLTAIGETTIDVDFSLENADPASDVGRAKALLEATNRTVQLQGWYFNKSKDITFVPDTEGYIALGTHILSVIGTTGNYIEKDHKLFDVTAYSFVFDKPVHCDIITLVPFDDVPATVVEWVVREAAVEFYNNVVGDTTELAQLKEAAQRTYVLVQKEENLHTKANLISGSRVVSRNRLPTGIR